MKHYIHGEQHLVIPSPLLVVATCPHVGALGHNYNHGSTHTYNDEGAARAGERRKKSERDANHHSPVSSNSSQAVMARRQQLRSNQAAARKDKVRKRATRQQISILVRVFEQVSRRIPLPNFLMTETGHIFLLHISLYTGAAACSGHASGVAH
jgi:hypothetical protein